MLTLFSTCQQASNISAIASKRLLLASLLAISSCLLLGCGQTGPLVLPEKPTDGTQATEPASSTPIKKR